MSLRRPFLLMLLIFLSLGLLFFSYHQILTSYFVSEDWEWFPQVLPLNILDVYKLFLPHSLGGIESVFFRPLITLTFWIDYQIGQLNPLVYHLTNLISHILNILLVFIIAQKLYFNDRKNDSLISLLIALLFAVFPFHSEAVTSIGNRADAVMTVFYLFSILQVLYFLEHKGKVTFYLSIFSFILALLSKENALSLPFVIIVLSLFSKKKIEKKYVLWFFLILCFWGVIKIVYFKSGFNIYAYNGLTFSRVFLLSLVLFFSSILITFSLRLKRWYQLNFFLLMIIVTLLPVALLPTEERFLYLPSAFGILMLGQFIKLVRQNFDIKRRYRVFDLMIMLIIVVLIIIEAQWLFERNKKWVISAQIVQDIINQTNQLAKNSTKNSTFYILSLPDNYHGAYIERAKFDLALKYNHVLFKKVVVILANNGVGSVKVTIKNQKSFILESETSFIIFRPAVTNYLDDGSVLIKNQDTSTLIDQSLHRASINILNNMDSESQVLYFDGLEMKKII